MRARPREMIYSMISKRPWRVSDYFFLSAARRPQSPALIVSGREYSYGELLYDVRTLQESMGHFGLRGSGHVIGVLSPKNSGAFAAQLAIMDLDCIYLPINVDLPPSAINGILTQAEARCLIYDPSMSKDLEQANCFSQTKVLASNPGFTTTTVIQLLSCFESKKAATDKGALAYLLFTSGSTGTPKGVAVSHKNAIALIESVAELVEFNDSDRFTQFPDLTFDLSVSEIFLCWRSGGCLVVPTKREVAGAVRFVQDHRITVWSSVPTLGCILASLKSLKHNSMPTLRFTSFCGESLSSSLTMMWCNAAPNSAIVNFYGPTEATVYSTYYKYHPTAPPVTDTLPIGLPLRNFKFLVVREDRGLVAPGEPGELLLAGPQVVAGYWNDAAATARSFVKDSVASEPVTWYKTGDIVSLVDGQLLFHGRLDRQIKLSGYRVDLHGIEATLRAVSGTELAAVLPMSDGHGQWNGIFGLVAGTQLSAEEILSACAKQLAPYALPSTIMVLGNLPMNANGKLDYLQMEHYVSQARKASKKKTSP